MSHIFNRQIYNMKWTFKKGQTFENHWIASAILQCLKKNNIQQLLWSRKQKVSNYSDIRFFSLKVNICISDHSLTEIKERLISITAASKNRHYNYNDNIYCKKLFHSIENCWFIYWGFRNFSTSSKCQ